MRRSIRLALAACVGFAALAFAGPALAVYQPGLLVTAFTPTPGKSTAVLLGVGQTAADDPTAHITIYVPLGYQTNLNKAAGAKIGDVQGDVILRGLGNAVAPIKGTVTADNPANYASQATQCTGVPTHEGVWKLDVTIAGSPLVVPLYLDHVTVGPAAAFASATIQLCLAGPIGTPGGAQLLDAFFDVNKVFTNPSTKPPGGYNQWRGVFTPYTPGTPDPNLAGTVEAQAFVPTSVVVKLKAVSGKRGRITITGQVLVNGKGARGVDAELYVGLKKVGKTMHTNSAGRFTARRRIKRKTTYRALATFAGDRPGGCFAPLPPTSVPGGCVGATISFIGLSNKATGRFRR